MTVSPSSSSSSAMTTGPTLLTHGTPAGRGAFSITASSTIDAVVYTTCMFHNTHNEGSVGKVSQPPVSYYYGILSIFALASLIADFLPVRRVTTND